MLWAGRYLRERTRKGWPREGRDVPLAKIGSKEMFKSNERVVSLLNAGHEGPGRAEVNADANLGGWFFPIHSHSKRRRLFAA